MYNCITSFHASYFFGVSQVNSAEVFFGGTSYSWVKNGLIWHGISIYLLVFRTMAVK